MKFHSCPAPRPWGSPACPRQPQEACILYLLPSTHSPRQEPREHWQGVYPHPNTPGRQTAGRGQSQGDPGQARWAAPPLAALNPTNQQVTKSHLSADPQKRRDSTTADPVNTFPTGAHVHGHSVLGFGMHCMSHYKTMRGFKSY